VPSMSYKILFRPYAKVGVKTENKSCLTENNSLQKKPEVHTYSSAFEEVYPPECSTLPFHNRPDYWS
jgi:hypothetical protein